MGEEKTVLLSSSYFGPIQYFTKFLLFPDRIIEQFDHYGKQTYRNRCRIYGANGILTLSIPVLKGSEHKTLVKDIRIDYSRNWRKLHWKSMESAYRHSPFFEFYMDDIRALLDRKHTYLLDLNLEVLDRLLDALEIAGNYSLTQGFGGTGSGHFIDLREAIHPKVDPSEDQYFRAEPYAQVFADRMGFKENLSIIDLLFNAGPDAGMILEKCIPPR